MTKNVQLLIIDPQNDFCDPERGSLFVKGADEDMRRLAGFIRENGKLINDIYVTLDSHHLIHVAHPIYWRNKEGIHPPPLTPISANEVVEFNWKTEIR
jgi:hypothetical protein